MAEFEDVRDQLGRARSDRAEAKDEQAQSREHLRRIAARESQLDRSFNSDSHEHQEKRNRLRAEREQVESRLNGARDKFTRAAALEAEVFKDFSRFTDPRQAIEVLSDSMPILLMPVRLETRFKTVAVGETRTSQLWVRIYPDDCWIDSFDPTLTETEVVDARAYWIGIWKAAGISDQERGAWKVLATSNGSGRARWIASQTTPVNIGDRPTKARAQDVVLTIATDTPLASPEVNPVSQFWLDAWRADGDLQKLSEIQLELERELGQDRAAEIIEKYQPVNFADPLPAGVSKDQLNVNVSFLISASIATKQSAWSHAPQLKTLPDRFVFLGYQNDKQTAFALGNPVPSPLIAGPDPSLPKEEQLQLDENGNLVVPEEIKWITDFDRAVELGMGFRINLDETQAQRGFDRVLVIGLRLNAKAEVAKAELENLFRNHSFSRTGLEIVKQGTPTNNTEAGSSEHGRLDDADASFDDLQEPLFRTNPDWLDKRDGQWVAEYLGIDPSLFEHVHNAGSTDQVAARAMNTALWPATLGYWMESMMAGVFTPDAIEQTRDYFNRFVVGAGAIPAIRIGAQPYGILPATKISRMRWLDQRSPTNTTGLAVVPFANDPLRNYLRRLYPILLALDEDWRGMSANVSFVGKSGDPHKILLDIVGLHTGSVEWSQRYAESLKTVFNRLNLLGFGGFIQAILLAGQRQAARGLIQRLGVPGNVEPLILEKVFSGRHNQLKGGVVDDRPLSETEGIREYTASRLNYIEWLIDAANTSLDALYNQNGFKDDKPPVALLYLMLRHGLQLGYDDVSIRMRERAGLLTAEAAMNARIDQPFLHISQSAQVSQSRYHGLFETVPSITGNPTQPLHQFIASQLPSVTFTFYLREQLAALNRLRFEPTARLERVFADHVDCCSYRLDAWLLGIVNYQLSLMRNIRDRQDSAVRTGIYLGAYAWLEDLRPENKVLTPVRLQDPELIKDFGADKDPLMRDSTNQGYIHGPSLNHSTAAAVLRNGFISNASRANRQTMAVNLTSERVRTALAMLEGIRAGQGLADLLGYQFERGLHDRHNVAEVDQFILDLRRKFPLRGDRMNSTKPPEGVSIEAIEARNVIDGLALVEQIKVTGTKTYPFGKAGLPDDLSQAQQDAINAEAERLLESHDAVADLALSEGVFQAVLGNYDRVASTYDAYAGGNFPPEPEIVRTPLNGIGITHRVALHLEGGANPNNSPIPGFDPTPRALAEPAVNNFLASILPDLDQVGCLVTFVKASTRAETTEEVTLGDLDLQPADLLAIIQEGNEQAMSELDDRVVRHAFQTFGPRPDRPVTVKYIEKDTAAFSVFQLLPLVRNLRQLITKSRPLRATDLSLANEAESSQDSQPFVDIQRLTLVHDRMEALKLELEAFKTQLAGPLSDLATRKNEILTDVDQYVDQAVDLMARAATFAVAQAGWGFAYDFRSRAFAAILQQFRDRVIRWDEQLVEFNNLLAAEAALPIAEIEQRLSVLAEAQRAISTAIPTAVDPDAFRNDLINFKLPLFNAKRTQLANVQDTNLERVSDLLASVRLLLPINDFDFVEFSLVEHENEMVRFAEDALAVTQVVITEVDQRLTNSQTLFDQHAVAADATTAVRLLEEAARTLLGEDFRIFPEFSLAPAQGDEVENALNASRSGDLFDYLKNPPDPNMVPEDFPVDTWLYGMARVREKMHAWEQTVMFTGSLGQTEPGLDAMQLPFIPGDRWLGLEFPPEQKLDTDRLLYTAHFAVAFNKTVRQCGMLLDEWAETIPTSEVDTGIAFHHDRPNCEAPQTMLLVTPSLFQGAWQWDDLVDALHETLDFAKRRAVEPSTIDQTPYAPFLPATIMAAQVSQLTIAANLAINNRVGLALQKP